jgi:hypothetical protein
MDWRLKGAVLAASSFVPQAVMHEAYRRFSRRAGKFGSQVQLPWEFHEKAIKRAGAKKILEFGGGKHLAQNLYLSQLDIEQTVIDITPLATLTNVNTAIERLDALGLRMRGLVSSWAELRDRYGIDYRAPLDLLKVGFAPGSFDMNISTSTLEHIPLPVLAAILAELRRMHVRTISAYIDYSDHYSHTDKSISRYNMARYPEWRWRLHNPPAHYQNRLRHGHYRDLFADAGYTITLDDPFDPESVPEWVRPELLRNDGFDHFTHGMVIAELA